MIIVSDHAVLRWLERRYGLNSEAFRQEIREVFEREGEFTRDGFRFVARDNRITTILPVRPGVNRCPGEHGR